VTLLLNRSELERHLDPAAIIAALRAGFTAEPGETAARRVVSALPGPGTATALIPGLVAGVPAYTVKVNAKFPASRPALRGVVCLHDLETGELLALLDSATVTAWRTGLAAALGTAVLARRGGGQVAVVGAGAQSDLVLRGLGALRDAPAGGPELTGTGLGITGLTVTDLDADRAAAFAERHGERLGVPAGIAVDARAAAEDADIVITATWARRPLLHAADIAPGTHLTALGADERGKSELAPDLLERARVVVDDLPLAVEMGVLATAGLSVRDAAGTLGDLLRGEVPGRVRDEEVTVYAPVGLPWQDLALSWAAYRAARAAGVGTSFDFLG
jgi:ornithine cyclodeaminase